MKTTSTTLAADMNVVSKIKTQVAAWLSEKNATFSSILEESFTNRQVLMAANFCFAFTFTTIFAVFSIPLLLGGAAWLLASVASMKKGGIR